MGFYEKADTNRADSSKPVSQLTCLLPKRPTSRLLANRYARFFKTWANSAE